MKTAIYLFLMLGSCPLWAVDAYNGKEFKVAQTIASDVTIREDLAVTGTLGVTGASSLTSATMTGPLTLSGSSLTVTGTPISAYFANKVGIGTAAPATKLHMSSGTIYVDGTGAGISTNNENGYGVDIAGNYIAFKRNGPNIIGIGSGTNSRLDITEYSRAAAIVSVTNAGLVGIGNTAPSNTLHVKGTTGIAVSSATTAGLSMVFRGVESKANILLTDPVAAWEYFGCTDCTAVTICTSTGTEVGAWVKSTDKTAACD